MPHSPQHLDPIDAFLHRIVPYCGVDTSPSVRALLHRAVAKPPGRNTGRRPDRPAAAQASLLPTPPKQDQIV